MAWPTPLTNHAQFFIEQVEPWKKDHDEVMRNHDNADNLGVTASYARFLLKQLRQFEADTFEESLAVYRGYISWHEQVGHLLHEIEKSETDGFKVLESEKLRSDFASVTAMMEIFHCRCEALECFVKGRGVSLEEFTNALPSRDLSGCSEGSEDGIHN